MALSACENRGFRKRRFRVYLWTGENEGFVYLFKMTDQKCMAILLGLISSIIACIQLHVTMLNVHGEYMRIYKYNEGAFRLKKSF